jgi:hypothetical protein
MKTQDIRRVAAAGSMYFLLAVALVPLFSAQNPQEFSDWSTPVSLGPPVNTPLAEIAPFISRDGLSLYYVRTASAGGFGGMDLWVSQRASADDSWGVPQNLGPTINTPANEFGPSLTPDGHTLYFASNRPGLGGIDLYSSRRHNKRDDLAWQPAVNLDAAINTAANELQAALFEDDQTGVITLYFASNRPGGLGGDDIYVSTLLPDETFGPPVLVQELSSPSADLQPAIRREGLELFLASSRPGSLGLDLWVSTRASTSDPWSIPVNLGPVVNSASDDARASLSFDGTDLYLQSNRAGNQDFYRSTRIKLTDR